MSLLSGLVSIGTGGLSGLLASGKKAGKNSPGAPVQSTADQLANLNKQVAADQPAIAAAAQSQTTWEYVAIGTVAVGVIGGALYFMKKKK